jgi:hypothetical protein
VRRAEGGQVGSRLSYPKVWSGAGQFVRRQAIGCATMVLFAVTFGSIVTTATAYYKCMTGRGSVMSIVWAANVAAVGVMIFALTSRHTIRSRWRQRVQNNPLLVGAVALTIFIVLTLAMLIDGG